MTEKSYSVVNALTDIIASPARAFDEIQAQPRWFWTPLVLTLGLASALILYFYNWVDFDWLIEDAISALPPENRADQEDAVRSFMTPTVSSGTGVAAIIIVSMIMYTLQAVYFNLVNKVTSGSDIRFGQWFSFTVWGTFPAVFGTIAAFVAILMADSNQMPAEGMQVLSMNNLFVHADRSNPWFTWASSLHLTQFWIIAVMAIGYSRWTDSGMGKSTVIAALPYALVFGIWALFI